MTLKEFRSMLLGAKLTVHTDHKNLTFNNLQTQSELRWQCYVEEYSPIIKYIEGPLNTIADTFSRLHCKDDGSAPVGKNGEPIMAKIAQTKDNNPDDNIEDNFYSILDQPEMVECFLHMSSEDCYLNLPDSEETVSPLTLSLPVMSNDVI